MLLMIYIKKVVYYYMWQELTNFKERKIDVHRLLWRQDNG